MKDAVNIPLSMEWSKEEIIDVVHFYEAIDRAYGRGVERALLLTLYQHFKKIVPSKSEEKTHFKEYQIQTNQSPYHVIKKAKMENDNNIIKMD